MEDGGGEERWGNKKRETLFGRPWFVRSGLSYLTDAKRVDSDQKVPERETLLHNPILVSLRNGTCIDYSQRELFY